MSDFIIRALIGGLGIATITGPLGCFLVWRKMAYFGDTLAHSALLGVALGILLQLDLNLSVLVTSILLALMLALLQNQKKLADDTLLGILAHSALALGMVVISALPNTQFDLVGYLFGDILAISNSDLVWIYASGFFILIILAFFWQNLLAMTVHEELAIVEGYPVKLSRVVLMLLIAFVIAIAMKIVGILLITSLLIIPAATARFIAKSPEQMAIFAIIIGMIAVICGLFGSVLWDIATGPAIVLAEGILFLTAHGMSKLIR